MNEVLTSTRDLAAYQPLFAGVSSLSGSLVTELSADEFSHMVYYFAKYHIGAENVWKRID